MKMESKEKSLFEMFNSHFKKKIEKSPSDQNPANVEENINYDKPGSSPLKTDKNLLISSKNTEKIKLKESIQLSEDKLKLVQPFSTEYSSLLDNIVALKLRLMNQELIVNMITDSYEQTTAKTKAISHHFEKKFLMKSTKFKFECGQCGQVIWVLGQSFFVCQNCSMTVHKNCMSGVVRSCVKITKTDKMFEERICPEIGLALQKYRCAGCLISLTSERKLAEARLCDYSGRRYCLRCHWNDTFIIPARVIQNWDFRQYKVAKEALITLKLNYEESSINLKQRNPSLFDFASVLSVNEKLRMDVCSMYKYISTCRLAIEANTLEKAFSGSVATWVQSPEMYSLADLVSIYNGRQITNLTNTFEICGNHIRYCELCRGRGYICEICKEGDVLFPFDAYVQSCDKCNLLYHRECFAIDNMTCKKCGIK